MVNYGNSPSSLGVLSAPIPALLRATTANDGDAGAVQARSGKRISASHRGDAKAWLIRPADPTRGFPQTFPHEMPLRTGMAIDRDRVRYRPASARHAERRQPAQTSERLCVRQRPCRGGRGPSARRMTKLRSCSLSYFISHSLLRGPGLRVATGPRSALPEGEKESQIWAQAQQSVSERVDRIGLILS